MTHIFTRIAVFIRSTSGRSSGKCSSERLACRAVHLALAQTPFDIGQHLDTVFILMRKLEYMKAPQANGMTSSFYLV